MAQTYRLVGAQDPSSRIDRVTVSEGQTLELNGEPMELDDQQVSELSRYVRLEPVSEQDGEESAEYTAEDYPDSEQNEEAPAQEQSAQPEQTQQVGGEAQPEPQPEVQQVARPRTRKEA